MTYRWILYLWVIYTLLIFFQASGDGIHISLGEIVFGKIKADEEEVVAFDAITGTAISSSIQIIESTNILPSILTLSLFELSNPNPILVVTSQDQRMLEIPKFFLQTSGTDQIKIVVGPAGTQYQYKLITKGMFPRTVLKTPKPTVIEANQVNSYEFAGLRNSEINLTLQVSAANPFTPIIRLVQLDHHESILVESHDFFQRNKTWALSHFQLPETGTYRIDISGDVFSDQHGLYTLEMTSHPPSFTEANRSNQISITSFRSHDEVDCSSDVEVAFFQVSGIINLYSQVPYLSIYTIVQPVNPCIEPDMPSLFIQQPPAIITEEGRWATPRNQIGGRGPNAAVTGDTFHLFAVLSQASPDELINLPVAINQITDFPGLLAYDSVLNLKVKRIRTDRSRFQTKEEELIFNGQPIFLKGVGYSPFGPGQKPGDIPSVEVITWDLLQMKQAHINAIRVYPNTMPLEFYLGARLLNFWLLQDIYLPLSPDLMDLHEPEFKQRARNQIELTIKRIHAMGGCDRIFAWSIGNEFPESVVIQTNLKHRHLDSYEGKFVQAKNITQSEVFIAEMVDLIKATIHNLHGYIPLVTLNNWVPLAPAKGGNEQAVLKCDFLDIICFNVYSYFPSQVRNHHPGTVMMTPYQGYIDELRQQYPGKPFIISEVGYSTSPIGRNDFPVTAPTYGYGGLTEEQQAEALEQRWNDIIQSQQRFSGIFVHEWSDEWWKLQDSPDDENTQDSRDPEEYFGLIEVRNFGIAHGTRIKKGAYYKLAELYAR